VGRQGHLEAAAEGLAVDGAYHRHVAVGHLVEERMAAQGQLGGLCG
jgi:hypothetical protein